MRYPLYSSILKTLGGKKWLKKATPEQKARLNSFKKDDEFNAKMNREFKERKIKPIPQYILDELGL